MMKGQELSLEEVGGVLFAELGRNLHLISASGGRRAGAPPDEISGQN